MSKQKTLNLYNILRGTKENSPCVTESKLELLAARQANKLRDELLG